MISVHKFELIKDKESSAQENLRFTWQRRVAVAAAMAAASSRNHEPWLCGRGTVVVLVSACGRSVP